MSSTHERPQRTTRRLDRSGCRFLDAARGRNSSRPPLWIMRQAGRYLPSYQDIRRRYTFREMCTQPEVAEEVSLLPFREFGLDAVIVFYDILFLPEAMGAPLEFTDQGPVFHRPVRSARDVAALRVPEPEEGVSEILETLRRLHATLPEETALLGFAGAPFTIAAYLVEGSFRRSGDRVRRLAHEDPDTLRDLLERITAATERYLVAQVEAGADAVQLFDTWAGLLSVADFEEFALPYQQRIFRKVAAIGAPTILYVNGSAHLSEAMVTSGAGVLSVDWRVPLRTVREKVGSAVALQGNLDPVALFAPPAAVKSRVADLLASMAGDPAYVCNLGHGILPETPVASVEALVAAVEEGDASPGDFR